MDAMQELSGFDALFISEVPDYLRCVVCQLVLRNPVQALKCGHKFCQVCFQRLKGYSEDMNTDLCCPVDREVIDLDTVCEDTGMNRIVGNLMVKCANCVIGCPWTGDLRDMKTHEGKCEFRVRKQECGESSTKGCDEVSILVKELNQRVSKCESGLLEKDKDIAFLKYKLQEVKKSFDEKLVEIDLLNDQNKSNEHELKLMKNQHQDLKQCEVKMENLCLKNVLLEQRVVSLEEQLMQSKKQMEGKEKVLNVLMDEVENIKSSQCKNAKELQELKSRKTNDEIIKLKDSFGKSLSKQSNKLNKLQSQLSITEEEVECKYNILEAHIANIENFSFCDFSDGSEEIVLEWNLQNYKYHFDIGKQVCSPVFFTQVQGYCFKIMVDWSGKKKGNLGIYLRLHCAKDYREALEPFNTPYTFELRDKDGDELCKTITSTKIEQNMKCFTISPGEDCSEGYGFPQYVSGSDVANYIINDMLCITCTLEPQ